MEKKGASILIELFGRMSLRVCAPPSRPSRNRIWLFRARRSRCIPTPEKGMLRTPYPV